ncbi:Selenoprotein O [Holothuria leucospilota]|uniref:Selenoprotein O n=1 Tax=Holothuria leucospilota TaxID=206669 RepID=A0A9Q1BB98_HOLLE|nr:Selenoprotein O [Holothuria leucospilota]
MYGKPRNEAKASLESSYFLHRIFTPVTVFSTFTPRQIVVLCFKYSVYVKDKKITPLNWRIRSLLHAEDLRRNTHVFQSGAKGCLEQTGHGTMECSQLENEMASLNHSLLREFEKWRFAKLKLLKQFPVDKEIKNFVRLVPNALFSKVLPSPLNSHVKLAIASSEVLTEILDLYPDIAESEFFVAFVSGNTFLDSSEPLAHRYGGHQFGSWSGQLGDGRAHLLGEYVNQWELQLKGSGLTPYSRRGDGRAVIRSSVREFLASEAMYHLGIPTSRAASLVVSDDPVWRDQFYDGNPKKERAAVVLRLAPSWFRIGSLEILTKNGEISLLRQLTDFIIDQYFPQTAKHAGPSVMNTDNFSILSLTIDYGPFGFLDHYDPNFVPNTSDDEGMYAIGNQATIGHFNLNKLREALLPLLNADGVARTKTILAQYSEMYSKELMNLFRAKLGLEEKSEVTEYLVAMLLKMMEDTKSDFTMTFRQLGEISLEELNKGNIPEELWALADVKQSIHFSEWTKLYTAQFSLLLETDLKRRERMNAINPRYILRNWMAQKVIEDVENNHFDSIKKLHRILQKPFTKQNEAEELGYSERPPLWAKQLRVSCSS